jgi:hypothetical protein
MRISYAITVCDEEDEIVRLIDFLLKNKRYEDEICVLLDTSKTTKHIQKSLWNYSTNKEISLHEDTFEGHFADWKNKLTQLCSGDYIFQIDADEIPHRFLLDNLPSVLENNSDLEVFLVPRVNTVEGITSEHIQKWKWNIDSKERVNWPDYQWRIWKNKPEIKWVNKVHEKLDGFKTYTSLPDNESYALFHPKTIEKQEAAVKLYQTLNPLVKEKI